MKTIRVLSIDPSKNRTGYASAVFTPHDDFRFPTIGPTGDPIELVVPGSWAEESSVWSWGFFDLSAMTYIARLKELCEFITMTYPEGFDFLICEWPMFFQAERGQVAAIRGDTINLAGTNCYIAGYFRVPTERVVFITANKWKGSVNKEITRRRFYASFGIDKHYAIDHNAVDAAQMLLTWCTRARMVGPHFVSLPKRLDQSRMHSMAYRDGGRNHTF